jgi:hypothetical protein
MAAGDDARLNNMAGDKFFLAMMEFIAAWLMRISSSGVAIIFAINTPDTTAKINVNTLGRRSWKR